MKKVTAISLNDVLTILQKQIVETLDVVSKRVADLGKIVKEQKPRSLTEEECMAFGKAVDLVDEGCRRVESLFGGVVVVSGMMKVAEMVEEMGNKVRTEHSSANN